VRAAAHEKNTLGIAESSGQLACLPLVLWTSLSVPLCRTQSFLKLTVSPSGVLYILFGLI